MNQAVAAAALLVLAQSCWAAGMAATSRPADVIPVLGGHLLVSVPVNWTARETDAGGGREPPPRVSRIDIAAGQQRLELTAVELFRTVGPDFAEQVRRYLPQLELSLGPVALRGPETAHAGLRLAPFVVSGSASATRHPFGSGVIIANADGSTQLILYRSGTLPRAGRRATANLAREISQGLRPGLSPRRYSGDFVLTAPSGSQAFRLMVPEGLAASALEAVDGSRIRIDRVVPLGDYAGNLVLDVGGRPAPAAPPEDAAGRAGIVAGQRVWWRSWTLAGDSDAHRIYHAETSMIDRDRAATAVHLAINAVSSEERERFLSLAATLRSVRETP